MNLGKVVFGFFILLAATLNFGFVYGDIDVPGQHHVAELFAAIVVNLIATILKFGDRTQVGAVHLATSLVADLQLLMAAGVWGWTMHIGAAGIPVAGIPVAGIPAGVDPTAATLAAADLAAATASVVSLAAGALFANIVSVLLLLGETLTLRR